MFSLLWVVYMPLLILCGFFGGIFLIITSVKHRKLFAGFMGLLSFSFVTLPFFLGAWEWRAIQSSLFQLLYIGYCFL